VTSSRNSHQKMEESSNPYSSEVHDASSKVSSFTGRIVVRLLFGMLYGFGFLFGSALLIGFGSGILFSILSASKVVPSDQQIRWIGISWITIPFVTGTAGFVLAILGVLPCARFSFVEKAGE
jgi:hypothetical protein